MTAKFQIVLNRLQSIIEEEGGAMPVNSDGSNNWDQPLIIAEPDVEVRDDMGARCACLPLSIMQVLNITERDQFLLLACDGLFDVFTPEEVTTFVKENMEKHGDTQRCCQVGMMIRIFYDY